MNSKIQSFRDLIVWQQAHKLAAAVYQETRRFPKEELFGLTSQMRRAAISVPSNIAEGFGRSSQAEKRNFYNIAAGFLTELLSQFLLSRDLTMLAESSFESLYGQATDVHRLLNALISKFPSR